MAPSTGSAASTSASSLLSGQSSDLHHLHAAYIALLSGSFADAEVLAGPSKQSPPSVGLAQVSLRSSNAFLSSLLQSSASIVPAETSNVARAPAIQGQEQRLKEALERLPRHWRLHNAFCPRCGGVQIPAVTASSLVRTNNSVGARKRRTARVSNKNFMLCLHCAITASASEADDSNTFLDAEEVEQKLLSKGRFPSVRKRKRQGSGTATGTSKELSKELLVNPVCDQVVKAGESSSKAAFPRYAVVPANLPQDASSTTKAKPEKKGLAYSSPAAATSSSAMTSKLSSSSEPPPKKGGSASQPSIDSSSLSTTKTSKPSKSDHKSALRAMLLKDSQKKKAQKQEPPKGVGPNGAGGGLMDFLAGL